MSAWLLVHPPQLGPAVLQPLAEELRRRGSAVAVPDLRAAVATARGWPQRWVSAAAAAGPAEVVVGFSGAGIVLPAVAAAAGARRVVWLDAVLPTGTWPQEIRELIAPLVRDGRIADWTTWWGPDAMTGLVPDERVRTAVLAEGHELPADFYDVAVPMRSGRTTTSGTSTCRLPTTPRPPPRGPAAGPWWATAPARTWTSPTTPAGSRTCSADRAHPWG